MCVCVYIYMCMYVCMCIYIYTYTYMYTYISIYNYTYHMIVILSIDYLDCTRANMKHHTVGHRRQCFSEMAIAYVVNDNKHRWYFCTLCTKQQ